LKRLKVPATIEAIFMNFLIRLQPKTLLWASVVVAIITIGLKTWLGTSPIRWALLSDAMESFVNLGQRHLCFD
jgi:divalent metal cation (Fe/Co/Zn/Cd) transporter